MKKFNSFRECIMVGGVEVGPKMSTRMSIMNGKMKGLLQVHTQAGNIVEEATSHNFQEPK
jgi:hypothetical protein